MIGFTLNVIMGNPLSVYGELIPVLCNISLLSYLVILYRQVLLNIDKNTLLCQGTVLHLPESTSQLWYRASFFSYCFNHSLSSGTSIFLWPWQLWEARYPVTLHCFNIITIFSSAGSAECEYLQCRRCWSLVSELRCHGSWSCHRQSLHCHGPLPGD